MVDKRTHSPSLQYLCQSVAYSSGLWPSKWLMGRHVDANERVNVCHIRSSNKSLLCVCLFRLVYLSWTHCFLISCHTLSIESHSLVLCHHSNALRTKCRGIEKVKKLPTWKHTNNSRGTIMKHGYNNRGQQYHGCDISHKQKIRTVHGNTETPNHNKYVICHVHSNKARTQHSNL